MEIVQVLKSLADETRLRIINLLKTGELCVCEIEEVLNIQQSNASRHLNKLKQAGIIVSEKKSQWVYYRLNQEIMACYPFLRIIIADEAGKLRMCQTDIARLTEFKASGLSCEELTKKH